MVSILTSIQLYAPNVMRVIITFSFSAMVGYVYSKADWNNMPYEVAAAKDAPGAMAEHWTLAEHAAWDFVKK